MVEKNRKSGITILGDVPWGTHFCQFYKTKKDLLDILVPYFTAGLENNEFCMWVTSEPLNIKEAEKALRNYEWPGNVRELSNVLERVISALEGGTIHLQNLPFYIYGSRKKSPKGNPSSLKEVYAKTEKEAIRYALKETNYNKARAAKVLGIHRTLLYKKMKKYKLPLNSKS